MTNPWVILARIATCFATLAAIVVHVAMLMWTGASEGFYSPAAVEVVQHLALALLASALVIWRSDTRHWAS